MELLKKNPNYKPPADFRPPKKTRKLFIPQRDHPSYNFIGLIIGPRGNTQVRCGAVWCGVWCVVRCGVADWWTR